MKKNVALMGVLAAAVMATSVPAVAADTTTAATTTTEKKAETTTATDAKKAEETATTTAADAKKAEATTTATDAKKAEETAATTAADAKKAEETAATTAVTAEKKAEEAVAPVAEVKPAVAATASDAIKVTIDGTAVVFDQQPVVKDSRTMVPLRAIFEAYGAKIEWNATTKTVVATSEEGVTITLTVGSKEMKVGDKVVTLDAPAQIIKDRTLVPVRAIAEAFGAEVAWDATTKTVAVKKPVKEAAKEEAKDAKEAVKEEAKDAKEAVKEEAKDAKATDTKTTDTKTTDTKTTDTTVAK